MSEPVSEIAFNSLPQAVRDWIIELGWKREDITSVHVNYGNPLVVTINKGQERQFCNFVKLDNGQLKKVEK